jgi:hypothetical protein
MSLPNRFGDISPRIGLSYQVMRKLVDSGAIGQHSYELRTEEADFAAQTKALEFLVEHGIVERVFENATSAGWRFTAAGCKRIQLSLVLHSPCRALAVRDVDLREMTVYVSVSVSVSDLCFRFGFGFLFQITFRNRHNLKDSISDYVSDCDSD